MNRSILIVICDFLLVSLLAFSTADLNTVVEEGTRKDVKVDITASQADNHQDLAAVMKLALEDERRSRDRLVGELTQTKDTAGKQQVLLSEREKLLAEERRNRDRLVEELGQTKDTLGKQQVLLSEREKQLADREKLLADRARQIQTYQQNLQTKEQQARQLEQERSALEQRMALTQTNLQNLQQQLQSSTTDALISKEKTAATADELRKQQEQAAALRQQLTQMAASNQVVQAEKQRLSTQLQVAESEKRSATEQLAKSVDEVKIERAEKARLTEHADKLAEGVKTLAANSGDLAHEIRDHRPLAPNTIFNEFVTNRVHARFSAHRPVLFGLDQNKHKETETVLVSDGTNYFALCHIDDTVLSFGDPGFDWESITGTLSRNTAFATIKEMFFHQVDPRVVFIPVSAAQAHDLGCKVYRVAADPYNTQEAVLVGAREGYYGECKFQIDLTTPQYLKMDRSVIRGLFGKFNPSHGDLVFNKSGDLLGVMANSTYCVMLNKFAAAASVHFGEDVRAQRTGQLLTQFFARVSQLPFKLQ